MNTQDELWRRRPLPAELRLYAADDAALLLPLHRALAEKVEEAGAVAAAAQRVAGYLRLATVVFDAMAREQLQEGSAVTGVVNNVTEFGAFVTLAPGVNALLHTSECVRAPAELPPPDSLRAPGRRKGVTPCLPLPRVPVRMSDVLRVRVLSNDLEQERTGASLRLSLLNAGVGTPRAFKQRVAEGSMLWALVKRVESHRLLFQLDLPYEGVSPRPRAGTAAAADAAEAAAAAAGEGAGTKRGRAAAAAGGQASKRRRQTDGAAAAAGAEAAESAAAELEASAEALQWVRFSEVAEGSLVRVRVSAVDEEHKRLRLMLC